MNEYDDANIDKISRKWKDKPCFEPKRKHVHYGHETYTDK